jgi:formylglycine-generating enzyme required for sulfatase activity
MLPDKYRWVCAEFEPEGEPPLLLAIAKELRADGNPDGAATVIDRAYGLDPNAEEIRRLRAELLNQLSVIEHGIHFRYVPAGVFLMGSWYGEPDERPVHPVWLSAYWMSETPVSWAAYCRLLGWESPPAGIPAECRTPSTTGFDRRQFGLHNLNKIRLQYCEDHTTRARDWHSHIPAPATAEPGDNQRPFRAPQRSDPAAPWTYENKPIVAVSWQEAEELATHLSTPGVRYSLPTEAQWEKAARGGLIGARYATGDRRPDSGCCDCDRFYELSIQPMTSFSANGYGLYAVNGCVWEWTSDWYDRDGYQRTSNTDPSGPATGEEKVLRGGSWSDCPEVVTVSFRMSMGSRGWRDGGFGGPASPNIGFRLCRRVSDAKDASPA